jgi:hypothetical protein
VKRHCHLAIVLAALAVTACSVRQDIDVRADGSGTVSVRVDLAPAFAAWLASMASEAKTLGLNQGESLFDEASVKRGAAEFAGTTVSRFASPSRERMEMTLAIADLGALGAATGGAGAQPLLTLRGTGSRRSLSIRLDAATFARIRPLLPGMDNALVDVLGPQEKDPYTAGEYDEVLSFTIDPQAPAWVASSRVAVTVRVPGRVVTQQGGRVEGNAVVFQIPLRDILLLREPMLFAVEWEQGSP